MEKLGRLRSEGGKARSLMSFLDTLAIVLVASRCEAESCVDFTELAVYRQHRHQRYRKPRHLIITVTQVQP